MPRVIRLASLEVTLVLRVLSNSSGYFVYQRASQVLQYCFIAASILDLDSRPRGYLPISMQASAHRSLSLFSSLPVFSPSFLPFSRLIAPCICPAPFVLPPLSFTHLSLPAFYLRAVPAPSKGALFCERDRGSGNAALFLLQARIS